MGFVRRRARRRTALLVGGAAYAAGRGMRNQNAGYQEPEYEQPPQQQIPAAPPEPAQSSPGIDVDELKRLGDLHAAGTLTDEEFASAKSRILGS